MPDTLKRLVGPTYLAVASATIYTVPAATVTAIRNVHICNTSASSQTFSLGINGAASAATSQVFAAYTIPPNGVFDWSGLIVLNAAEYLTGLCSTASTLTIYMSGVEAS